jgi:hypothetical protein
MIFLAPILLPFYKKPPEIIEIIEKDSVIKTKNGNSIH